MPEVKRGVPTIDYLEELAERGDNNVELYLVGEVG